MRSILAAVAMFGFGALAAPATAQQDVLAPARAGQVQCYSPDVLRKTCGAIASYNQQSDGSYENRARVLVAREPVIIMSSTSPVTIRDGAVCGPLTQEHLSAAQFTIDGLPAAPQDTTFLREQVARMPGFLADEICTTYTPAGDGLRAEYTINGARSSDTSQVIWVRADEGYRVAP